jgi:hypothetical protein
MTSENIVNLMIEAAVVYVEPQKDGAGDRDRTGDIQLGKLAFYR